MLFYRFCFFDRSPTPSPFTFRVHHGSCTFYEVDFNIVRVASSCIYLLVNGVHCFFGEKIGHRFTGFFITLHRGNPRVGESLLLKRVYDITPPPIRRPCFPITEMHRLHARDPGTRIITINHRLNITDLQVYNNISFIRCVCPERVRKIYTHRHFPIRDRFPKSSTKIGIYAK